MHLWPFCKSLTALTLLHRLVLSIELGTVQTGTGKVDPTRKFKCTTAARVISYSLLIRLRLGNYLYHCKSIHGYFSNEILIEITSATCDPTVASYHAKIDVNFPNYFLKPNAKNKCVTVLKCTCLELEKNIFELVKVKSNAKGVCIQSQISLNTWCIVSKQSGSKCFSPVKRWNTSLKSPVYYSKTIVFRIVFGLFIFSCTKV